MLSTLRRFIIYSDLQAARARMNTAMGLDPNPPTTQGDHVGESEALN